MALDFLDLDLGTHQTDYREAWELQRRLHGELVAGDRGDTVILLEHDPVYTAGKRTEPHELAGIAKKIGDLGNRSRNGGLMPDDLTGGTFTITNYGSVGTLFDTPIINLPQVAILGTGALVKRPMVLSNPELGDTIAIREMMYLSLTYDHRLVDGADAGRFLSALKARLEEGEFEAEFGL